MKTIIVPMDLSIESQTGLKFAIMLSGKTGANIHMIYVIEKNEELEKKHQLAKIQFDTLILKYKEKILFKTENLQGENIVDLTLEYSNLVNADLISIMTEQNNNISNLFFGSFAHQIINMAFIPVLSFPTYQLSSSTESFRTTGQFTG